ncbi:Acyl-CoA:1-acyl-sn-glycerol-3-phosphate acyltransferase [hydrothermal vent metagenome]|uniref:Acyl-CoA:1-acyl-sn-glycerol-3-phosphate acyltransferase n=1 Tax=hydrothermal vent metagenome TaxID=652676 RepID=A0A3B0VPS8_9ZZZZ
MSFIRGYYRLSLSGLTLIVFTVLIVLTSYLPVTIKKAPLSMRMTQLLTIALLWTMNVRVICSEKEKLRNFDGYFFPNHLSYLEVLTIFSIMPTRFLAKAEIRGWFAIGAIAAAVGCVFVQRGNKKDRKQARHALAQVATTPPITIFPEGTRGPGDQLRPFRHGAFEIVIENGSTYLPIAFIFSDLELGIWRHKENLIQALWRLNSQPKKVTVTVLPLEPQSTSPDDDPVTHAEKTRETLTAVLFPNTPPPTTG